MLILYLFYNVDLLDITINEDGLRYSLVIRYINNKSIIVNRRNTEEIIITLLILYERVENWAYRYTLVFAL